MKSSFKGHKYVSVSGKKGVKFKSIQSYKLIRLYVLGASS